MTGDCLLPHYTQHDAGFLRELAAQIDAIQWAKHREADLGDRARHIPHQLVVAMTLP